MIHIPQDSKRDLARNDLLSPTAPAEPAEAKPLVFLSKAQVLQKIPITAPTLWSWVRQGKFPAPRSISNNKVVWIEAEVDAWMRAQLVPRYKQP
jgi:predicted DNA-binding transcriptional regulator AlpA